MTLLEIALALPIVLIALTMLVQLLTVGGSLRGTGRDNWIASSAAQTVLEQMRNENYRDLVSLYNEDPFDDPSGPGTAPGAFFEVEGLTPVDETVGRVILPLVNTGTDVVPVWEVREDMDLVRLSMPQDLDGNVLIDDADHAADHRILPVEVELRWRAATGVREFRLRTSFVEVL